MKFLCLGYYDAAKMDAQPPEDLQAVMSQCRPYLDTFLDSGQVVLDAGLEPETLTLRQADGRPQVGQGRYLPGQPLIGSVSIIEAVDLEAAAAIASKHPASCLPAGEAFGWVVEVRPIHHFVLPAPAA